MDFDGVSELVTRVLEGLGGFQGVSGPFLEVSGRYNVPKHLKVL